jgi:tryptophan synthase alpha chain
MFSEIFAKKSRPLIPFLMAGYPNLEATEKIADALIEEGVSILELGIPFSDPLADGPVIQMAAEASLKNGTTLTDVLELCQRLTKKHPQVQVVLFTYLNPLLAYGLAEYARDAKKAGAAATLTVDLPPEEAMEYLKYHKDAGLKTVFLAAPTTSHSRLVRINECSSAFVYYVSRAGVTGEQAELSSSLQSEVEKLRQFVSKPVAVGFGISQPEHAKTVAQFADGVVIGSALIRLMSESKSTTVAIQKVRELVRNCFRAMS